MDPDCGYQTAGSHCYPGFGFILKCRCIENPRRGSAKLAQPVSFSPSSLPQQFEVAEEEPSRPLRRLLCRVRWSRVEGHAGQDRPIGPKNRKGQRARGVHAQAFMPRQVGRRTRGQRTERAKEPKSRLRCLKENAQWRLSRAAESAGPSCVSDMSAGNPSLPTFSPGPPVMNM